MQVMEKNADILSQASALLINSKLVPEGLEKDHLTLFYQPDEKKNVIGLIGVELYSGCCLLRSLAVREDRRNQGIARSLIKEALKFAYDKKSFDVYLITETIGDTMERYGFVDVGRESAPSDLLESPFFHGICPCSSRLMHKNIQGRV